MVKPQRSAGRKSTPPVHREQDSRRADMKTRSSLPIKSSDPSPGQSPDPAATEDPLEQQVPAKPLWKPIPPLLPEPEGRPETREQSCQTEAPHQGPPHSAAACVEPGDPPLLQQPLQTSKSGIQQIIECFRSGTSQLKTMLLRDVETIFECKLCRSLFRGLPNLITHKEYYCLSRSNETDGDDRQNLAIKDLLEAIYPRADHPENVVRLEPIQTTTKAVFQYLTTEEDLARYQSRTPSSRESPVAWEAEPVEGPGNDPVSQVGSEKRDTEEEVKSSQPEDDGSTSGVDDVTISCCLCGQDFNSRRSIRRHCRKMHQTKLEELRKFTETRTVPTSLLSMVKGPNRDKVKLAIDFGSSRDVTMPTGKSCQVCFKTFATKANVRRHFDEVHRGLRRDMITPGTSSKPPATEATPPKKSNNSSPTRGNPKSPAPVDTKSSTQSKPSVAPSTSASRCSICKRNYSSQLMYKRHLRIVHKIYSVKNKKTAVANVQSKSVRVKQEVAETSDQEEAGDMDTSTLPADGARNTAQTAVLMKVKEEDVPAIETPSRPENSSSGAAPAKMSKLSVGFDFKQLFCKLCKRQFSSRQNLSKHIELHTDGNDIFIKFYRCPLCRYESRRKRDVLRHVTVVHKKSPRYLAKIMPKLESRAVKRQAEAVLNSTPSTKRSGVKEELNGDLAPNSPPPPPSPPVTRKQEAPESSSSSLLCSPKHQEVSTCSSAPSSLIRKQERQQPPITRRSDKLLQQRNSFPSLSSSQQLQTRETTSTEVKVTKNFSLHACDQCGKAFAKKVYLESHKRSHRNAEETESSGRRKGVNTRSKSLVW